MAFRKLKPNRSAAILVACCLALPWCLSSARSLRGTSLWTSLPALSNPAGCVSWLVSLRRICRSTWRCCQSISFSVCPFFDCLRLFPVVSLWLGRPILSRAHTISILAALQLPGDLIDMLCDGFPHMLVSDSLLVSDAKDLSEAYEL